MKTKDLNKFKGLKVDIKYKKIMDKYGKKTVSILYTKSPSSGRLRATPYAKGWVAEPHISDEQYEVVVWNKTNWQLTHLLENGHIIKNRKDGLFWSPPNKHIRESYNAVKNGYIHAMEKAEVSADFK